MRERLKAIIALMRNPRVSTLPKILVIGAIAYILWPIDAVPDIAPVVGWLDDLMFLIGALSLLLGSAPKGGASKGEIIDVTPEKPPPGPPPPR